MKIQKQYFMVLIATMCLVSSCAVVPLAGVALGGLGIYNTVNPEKNVNITMANSDLQRMRSQLNNVNHLAILANNSAAISFSDVWEKAGKRASIVSNQGDPAAISLSQARDALASACKSGVHASAYGRPGNRELNRLGLLIGKAQTTLEAELYVFNCSARKLESAPITIAFNALGKDDDQLDRSIGSGLAAKLLEISN